jgi:hypothetical protein
MKETLRTALEAIKPWHRFRQGYTLGELANPSVLREYAGGVFSAIASWANAGSWPLMVQMAKGEFPDMSETDVLELCRALKYEPAT